MSEQPPAQTPPQFHDDVAAEAVKIALAEAASGVFENNNDNRGPRVDEYQMVGGMLGEMCCAKFAYWCFQQAAFKLNTDNPFPRLFGSARLEKWGEDHDRLFDTPQRGHVFVKAKKHVGIVTGPALDNGTFPSVEGNTYAGAVRRDGVYTLNKTLIRICRFIRL